MKNEWKRFEEDFIKSVPKEWEVIRLKDWGGRSNATNTRFTISNDCDFILFTGKSLIKLELKSTKWWTLPLKNIKPNQLKKLSMEQKDWVFAYFIINYRLYNETYIIDPINIVNIISYWKKSISRDYAKEYWLLLPQEKKISRYRYLLNNFHSLWKKPRN